MSDALVWVGLIGLFCILGTCAGFGYLRRFMKKMQWEEDKKKKDELAAAIDAGDTSKQAEYDEVCMTPDTFDEPDMNEWTDYILWYVVEPFFNVLMEKFDKFFMYTGWASDAIDVFLTLYIIIGITIGRGAETCCNYAGAPQCTPANENNGGTMGDFLQDKKIEINDDGFCVVDGLTCQGSCPSGSTLEDICGQAARNRATFLSILWVVIFLALKLVKIGWSYYISITIYRNKTGWAKKNHEIRMAYLKQHADYEPAQDKRPRSTSAAAAGDGTEAEKEKIDATTDAEAERNDMDLSDGPEYIEFTEPLVCGFVSMKNEKYVYFHSVLMICGALLSFLVLYFIGQSNGIIVEGCGDADESCRAVYGSCANAGELNIQSDSSSGGTTVPVYAVLYRNDFDGPALIGFFATILGYIAYVPWFRGKLDQVFVEKGWKKADSEADAVADFEMWSGLM